MADMTRQDVEKALDAGFLYTADGYGQAKYKIRRNGRTRTWKTRPTQFEIPIKWSFRSTGTITDVNINSGELIITQWEV